MAADHVRGAREAPGGSCEAANHGVFFAQIAEVLEGELPSVAEAEGGARRASMRLLLHLANPSRDAPAGSRCLSLGPAA